MGYTILDIKENDKLYMLHCGINTIRKALRTIGESEAPLYALCPYGKMALPQAHNINTAAAALCEPPYSPWLKNH